MFSLERVQWLFAHISAHPVINVSFLGKFPLARVLYIIIFYRSYILSDLESLEGALINGCRGRSTTNPMASTTNPMDFNAKIIKNRPKIHLSTTNPMDFNLRNTKNQLFSENLSLIKF